LLGLGVVVDDTESDLSPDSLVDAIVGGVVVVVELNGLNINEELVLELDPKVENVLVVVLVAPGVPEAKFIG